jgi:tetratricopeptide (TPR) repeat protein
MKSIFVSTLFSLLACNFSFSQSATGDSLKTHTKLLEKQPESITRDTSLNKTLNLLAREYAYTFPDSAIYFTNQAITYAKKAKWETGIALSLHQTGLFYSNKGDFPNALKYFQETLKIWTSALNSKDSKIKAAALKRMPITLRMIGIQYDNSGQYPRAIEYYLKALKFHDEAKDKAGQAKTIGNIGLVYANMREYTKALDHYNKALKIDTELDNQEGIGRHLGNMAIVYHEQGKLDEALEAYSKALILKEKYSNSYEVAYTLGNIGNTISTIAELRYSPGLQQDSVYSKALEYDKKALTILKEIGDLNGVARNLGNIGIVYAKQKKYKEAEKYLIEAIALCDSIEMPSEKMQFEVMLSETYEKRNDFKNAFYHYRSYSTTRDSLFNIEKNKELTSKQLNYEFEKKQVEQQLKTRLEKEKILAVAAEADKRQWLIIFTVACILLVVIVFSFFLYSRFRITRKQKNIIEQQKLEVEMQKEIVEEKQKDMLDSIRYAKRIQQALITNENYIDKHLKRLQNKNVLK